MVNRGVHKKRQRHWLVDTMQATHQTGRYTYTERCRRHALSCQPNHGTAPAWHSTACQRLPSAMLHSPIPSPKSWGEVLLTAPCHLKPTQSSESGGHHTTSLAACPAQPALAASATAGSRQWQWQAGVCLVHASSLHVYGLACWFAAWLLAGGLITPAVGQPAWCHQLTASTHALQPACLLHVVPSQFTVDPRHLVPPHTGSLCPPPALLQVLLAAIPLSQHLGQQRLRMCSWCV